MDDVCKNQLIIELNLKFPRTTIYECISRYKYHKLNGPAVILVNGYKEWRIDDKLHNQNGPAVLSINGYKAWWVDNELVETN